jgi:hypothetical protein
MTLKMILPDMDQFWNHSNSRNCWWIHNTGSHVLCLLFSNTSMCSLQHSYRNKMAPLKYNNKVCYWNHVYLSYRKLSYWKYQWFWSFSEKSTFFQTFSFTLVNCWYESVHTAHTMIIPISYNIKCQSDQ